MQSARPKNVIQNLQKQLNLINMKNIALYISCMLPVTKETIHKLAINLLVKRAIQQIECEFVLSKPQDWDD